MNISLAPMEGITTYIYRRRQSEFFTAPDRFFTPYLSPAEERIFSSQAMEEILPEHNRVQVTIPQLMVNRADLCLLAIRELQGLGYREVNLNFGCPSGNVTRKHKGSGILAFPDELDRLLDDIFSASPLPVSVKTRIGYHDPSEFASLLAIYRRYPLKELIVHPRVRDEFYHGPLHLDAFNEAVEGSPFPVIYNGDIRTRADIVNHSRPLPDNAPVRELMLGRGLIAQPDLLDPIPASMQRILDFHRQLEEDYREILPSETAVLVKMKRILTCRLACLPHTQEHKIAILSAPDLTQFHRACAAWYMDPSPDST